MSMSRKVPQRREQRTTLAQRTSNEERAVQRYHEQMYRERRYSPDEIPALITLLQAAATAPKYEVPVA